VKGTGLEKAVAALDTAFAALPLGNKRSFALAIYRIWPAALQYQADVQDLMPPAIGEAAWRILAALVFVLPRGKDHATKKLAEAFNSHAPNLRRFIAAVAAACSADRRPEVSNGKADPESLPQPPPLLPER
jgi:hypothetical protein